MSAPENGFSNGSTPGAAAAPASMFSVYKPGQGYYTRLGTGIAAGVIAAFGAHWAYGLLTSYGPAVQMGIPAVLLALCGLGIWWVCVSGQKTNDFFIATEGEMKKVSWSTRREVIGSTKVVLLFTLMVATLLFVVDILFMLFFSTIGVLEIDLGDILGF